MFILRPKTDINHSAWNPEADITLFSRIATTAKADFRTRSSITSKSMAETGAATPRDANALNEGLLGCCRLIDALLGVKRTWLFAPHMSAYDPKRTWPTPLTASFRSAMLQLQMARAGLGDSNMRRRDFIKAIVGSALTCPHLAQAQQNGRIRRIAALMPFTATDAQAQARNAAFLQGLQQLGWTVGRNIQIDYRWSAGNVDDTRKYASELVALAPDLIFVLAPRLWDLCCRSREVSRSYSQSWPIRSALDTSIACRVQAATPQVS